jgi:hypothetical protein
MDYIVKRTFAKRAGLAYTGEVISDIPEPYLSDWLNLGLIEAYDATSAFQMPEYVSTGTGMKRVETEKPKVKEVIKIGGKPNKKTRKK